MNTSRIQGILHYSLEELQVFLIDKWISNFSIHQDHVEYLLKHRSLSPIPRVSDTFAWRNVQEFPFLTSSQVVLILLIHGPHFENQNEVVHLFRCLIIPFVFTPPPICVFVFTYLYLELLISGFRLETSEG